MTISGKIALAGAYEHPTRWAPEKSESLIMAECARGALEDAGLELSDVDGLFAASMSMGIMGVVTLAEYLNIKPRYLDGTNIGGSSFVARHGCVLFRLQSPVSSSIGVQCRPPPSADLQIAPR